MFWTVWGASPPGVYRALLSGEGRVAVAALKLVYPSALTLDPAQQHLYWVDTYLECVERTDYDGHNRKTIHRGYVVSPVFHNIVLAITIQSDRGHLREFSFLFYIALGTDRPTIFKVIRFYT